MLGDAAQKVMGGFGVLPVKGLLRCGVDAHSGCTQQLLDRMLY